MVKCPMQLNYDVLVFTHFYAMVMFQFAMTGSYPLIYQNETKLVYVFASPHNFKILSPKIDYFRPAQC